MTLKLVTHFSNYKLVIGPTIIYICRARDEIDIETHYEYRNEKVCNQF